MQVIALLSLYAAFLYLEPACALPLDNNSSSLVRRLPSGAMVYQLSKRGSLANETTGELDQDLLDAHIRYV